MSRSKLEWTISQNPGVIVDGLLNRFCTLCPQSLGLQTVIQCQGMGNQEVCYDCWTAAIEWATKQGGIR